MLTTGTPLPNASLRPDWSRRIPALDGLRGIAILLVLLCHVVRRFKTNSSILSKAFNALLLSWTGVDLFFVLSGFLIGGILLDARESPNYFKTFYVRRFYRIFPLYFAVGAGLFLLNYIRFPPIAELSGLSTPLRIPWFAYATFTQNFWMAKLGGFGPPLMGITWSLAVEEQFYLTIPFLIRKIAPRRFAFLIAAVIAAAPLLRFFLSHSLPNGRWACYVLMPCRADALGLGVLCAYLVREDRFWHFLIAKRAMFQAVTLFLFSGLIFMTYRHWEQLYNRMVTIGYSWLAFFYACCLLLAVSSQDKSPLRNPALMKLGTLAYCSYLVHFPLILIAQRVSSHFFPSHPNVTRAMVIVCIPATLGMANLSWKYFEKPMLRRGHAYNYHGAC